MKKEALEYHKRRPAGKLEVRPTKKMDSDWDLSLAYSPGVAEPCLAIHKDPEKSYEYTGRGNLVAVVTNGSAVLGLGAIGPLAGKPVMEGKAALFKKFAGINVFDLEIKARSVEEFVAVCKSLEPSFGGLNLEDISAPDCFEIERILERDLKIPVFHDDQHGTAIITAAAFLNGAALQGKAIEGMKVVFSGAGAAGISCAGLLSSLGARRENMILCDSLGVIFKGRKERMNPYKAQWASFTKSRSLREALVGADAFIGLSAKGLVDQSMVKSMSEKPLIFAMANPDPEIHPLEAKKACPQAIVATGRSDFPNQVNNVLGFPFIFRGALDVRATHINQEMKLAAVQALADLARSSAPEKVSKAYHGERFSFGPDYIIPKPFDPRALTHVASAVARAAIKSGVARRPIKSFKKYIQTLETLQSESRGFVRAAIQRVQSFHIAPRASGEPRARRELPARREPPARGEQSLAPPRILLPEGENEKVLAALNAIAPEKILTPILIGDERKIQKTVQQRSLARLKAPLITAPEKDQRLKGFAQAFYEMKKGKVSLKEAESLMRQPNYFAAMALQKGHAEGLVTGVTDSFANSVLPSLRIIGSGKRGVVAGVNLILLPNRALFFADTAFNINPSAEQIAHIAIYTASVAQYFSIEPRIALLSFVNFSDGKRRGPRKMRQARNMIRKWRPDLKAEGEVQADIAVNGEIAQSLFPQFSYSGGANVLIFPNLESGNMAYKLAQQLGPGEVVGPLLMGIKKPVNVVQRTGSVEDIINALALTALKTFAYRDKARSEGQGGGK